MQLLILTNPWAEAREDPDTPDAQALNAHFGRSPLATPMGPGALEAATLLSNLTPNLIIIFHPREDRRRQLPQTTDKGSLEVRA